MFPLDLLLPTFNFGQTYIQKLLLDIPDERLAEQPFPRANHAAWTVAHLAWAHDNHIKYFGAAPQLADFQPLVGMGSTPVAERAKYPSKEKLLAMLEDANTRFVAAIRSASADLFDQPTPERIRQRFPNVGQMTAGIMTGHYASHMGQLSAWRRAMGYGPVF